MNDDYNSIYKNDFTPYSGKKDQIHLGLWWLLVFVLLALAFVIWSKKNDGNLFKSSETVEDIGSGKTLVTSEEGKVISGFPRELLLERGVEVLKSYSINSSNDKTIQPVVEYYSELSLSENIIKFGSYLKENNWTIINEPKEENYPVASFYARKDNQELNLTFSVEEENSALKVIISYVLHQ